MKTEFILPFGLGGLLALAVVSSAMFAQPYLAAWSYRSSSECPLIPALPISFQSSGFLMNRPTTSFPKGMQFVIKPNSTAFLQINYNVLNNNTQSIYANQSKNFMPIDYWYKMGSSYGPGLTPTQVGMAAAPVNVTMTGSQSLAVTYEVVVAANAQEAAYTGAFWSTCGPQIVLTIGYSYYAGPGLSGMTL